MLDPTQIILMYFIMPVWLLAGFADWLCHRNSHIATTSGLKESAIHILMFAEVGIPLLMVLFFEVNALVILVTATLFIVHELTALWDVSYASEKRYVSPIEQHVHSFLEMIPLMALILVIATHWNSFLSLFGIGNTQASLVLELKDPALPTSYIFTVLFAVCVVAILPYGEEFYRCYKAGKK
ncbi:diguanylate cyclase [Alteromonas sp. C1M14]|uniref:diguanylate cyclase n=1 Tax=Alteromonas sp. C1M14 TaxID=2841567 RepID=UPI001C0951A6|nr:diguanylate cyclase [Alteromonas sp. C1M14]MBU2977201.1 diguanylate cyclase [Alteromonas sp. C1M14]